MDAAMTEQAEFRRLSSAVAGATSVSGSGIVIPGRALSKIRRGL
jgi:hypothetical protein